MTTRKPSTKGLTDKEKAFCIEYIKDWNATRAAIAAGYSEHTAREIGCQNLAKIHIKEQIDWNKAHLEEVLNISKSKVLAEHFKIAFSSIAHLHNTWIERKDFEQLTNDQKECIAEIDTKVIRQVNKRTEELEEIEYVRVKLYDKQKALDAISKIMGYDAPSKISLDTPAPIQFVNVSKQFPG
jgi:phage terminase small subunit